METRGTRSRGLWRGWIAHLLHPWRDANLAWEIANLALRIAEGAWGAGYACGVSVARGGLVALADAEAD
jgi:hypothetical protein